VGEEHRRQREGGDADADRPPDEAAAKRRCDREEAEISKEAGPDEAEGEAGVDR
jgi:hypothetical protein